MVDQKGKARVQHLSWRAGFGAGPAYINTWDHRRWNRFMDQVLRGGGKAPTSIEVPEATLQRPAERMRGGAQTAEERKARRRTNAEGMRRLNLAWMDQMCTTDHPLREKMSLFWHGHFACRVNDVRQNQLMLDVIRTHALGSFRDLLFGVSKSAAMLRFLNNQQNRKQHPNENFGREVMELFTMGRGNYTEKDVKEGSRAFTGWGYDAAGQFVFRKRQHDQGSKTFLGRTGNFDGDDILDIILEQKATAHHITGKICRFFVNDNPDPDEVSRLADRFYQGGYKLGALMEDIFRSEWFYAPENRGNLIKSPVELLAGMRRSIPVSFGKQQVQLLFQRIMDQTLFYPPNVGGWPGGRDWIDSSTLLFRMRLPQIVYYSETVTTRPKDMPDELTNTYSGRNMSDQFVRNFAKRVDSTVDWDSYTQAFRHISDDELPGAVADALLSDSTKIDLKLLDRYADHSSRENLIKSLSIDVMSSPEYQLS